MDTWTENQHWESDWWGTCVNTFGEEAKQISYAHRMGLVNNPIGERWPGYDLEGRSVIDIGGGPVSILLKCRNGDRLTVLDPLEVPGWVRARYALAGIELRQVAAEEFDDPFVWDEAWLYNVLQHVQDPKALIENAWRHARRIRIIDFPYTDPHPGHPHRLEPEELDEWLGGKGTVEVLDENGLHGYVYYGVFERR